MNPTNGIALGRHGHHLGRAGILAGLALAAIAAFMFWNTDSASAHCDSTSGPVVKAAEQALATGNVKFILPFVKEEQEAELTAAFKQAFDVRQMGGNAQALADRYFFETAVRLHRQGEGAAYTGLKDGEPLPPALEAAEFALESGDLAGVYKIIDEQVRTGIEAHYHAVLEAREAEAKKPTVENARARVEAEFAFEKFILGISDAAQSAGHVEGGAAPAHSD